MIFKEMAYDGNLYILSMQEIAPHIKGIPLTSENHRLAGENLLTADLAPVSAAEVIHLIEAKPTPSISPSIAEVCHLYIKEIFPCKVM